jgi:hypothetical protein
MSELLHRSWDATGGQPAPPLPAWPGARRQPRMRLPLGRPHRQPKATRRSVRIASGGINSGGTSVEQRRRLGGVHRRQSPVDRCSHPDETLQRRTVTAADRVVQSHQFDRTLSGNTASAAASNAKSIAALTFPSAAALVGVWAEQKDILLATRRDREQNRRGQPDQQSPWHQRLPRRSSCCQADLPRGQPEVNAQRWGMCFDNHRVAVATADHQHFMDNEYYP